MCVYVYENGNVILYELLWAMKMQCIFNFCGKFVNLSLKYGKQKTFYHFNLIFFCFYFQFFISVLHRMSKLIPFTGELILCTYDSFLNLRFSFFNEMKRKEKKTKNIWYLIPYLSSRAIIGILLLLFHSFQFYFSYAYYSVLTS